MFTKVIEDIAKNIKVENSDYEKNGLLYCGKCNTPKQAYIPAFGRNMPVICKCREATVRQQAELEEKIKKQKQIERLRRASLLGEKYRNALFENTETAHSNDFEHIYNRCRKYCENADKVLEKGIGIYLFGEKGTGKTRLTACMGNELMKNYYTVLYTNFAEISRGIFKEDNYIDRLARIDFLFIDDFGTEKITKGNEDLWLQEKVFEVVNKRYIENKPIIFTSNYSILEMMKERGLAERTADRIVEMCEAIKLNGDSYRALTMRKRERLF